MASIFSISESALFFRLALFHLLLYFFVKPVVWKTPARHSLFPVWYGLTATGLVYLFIGEWQRIWISLIIGVAYGLAEWLWPKIIQEANRQRLPYFLVNQTVHFSILLLSWLLITSNWIHFGQFLSVVLTSKQVVAVLTGYVLCTTPIGFLIGLATKKWQDELSTDSESSETLADAGRWIGISERLLIFSLVLVDQYEAIGFLIAAKSILRFREKEHKRSEYVLIGTLLSFGLAIMTGILLKVTIQ